MHFWVWQGASVGWGAGGSWTGVAFKSQAWEGCSERCSLPAYNSTSVLGASAVLCTWSTSANSHASGINVRTASLLSTPLPLP